MGDHELKTNTACIIAVGPFLDKTDGVTLENGLTISNERITLIAVTDDGSAPTLILDNITGATSGTDNDLKYISNNDAAMMQIELTAANLNRYGKMILIITDEANHLPVFEHIQVVSAQYWDAKYGSGLFSADAKAISGDTSAADNLEAACDGNTYNVGGGAVVAASVTSKTGFELSSSYDPAKSAASQSSVDAVDSVADAIKAKTDNLPSDPADQSAVEAAITAAHSTTNGKVDTVDTVADAIKAKTDNLPASPAAVGSKMDIVDAPSSTGLGAIVTAIWAKLISQLTTTGSIGKLISDYLDAAISSRLATSGYTAPPSVGAIADQVFDEALSGHTVTGSAGKALADATAPTVGEIDAQLSASHGASAWGASAVGSITYPDPDHDPQPFLDPEGDPLAGVKIEAYSDEDRTTLVDVKDTDINGMFAFHLDAGTYYFRAILAGYGNYEWSVELIA